MFKRVLIANRGEIAQRIVRCCIEMGVECVAAYSEADKDQLYVGLATQAICIGDAPAAESYLNQERLVSAACTRGTASSPRTPTSPASARTTASSSSALRPRSSSGWGSKPQLAS